MSHPLPMAVPATDTDTGATRWHAACHCHPSRRRWLGHLGAATAGLVGAAAAPLAAAQSLLSVDVPECRRSSFTQVVDARQIEAAAAEQYHQLLAQARAQGALAPAGHPQLERLRAMARRMAALAPACNPQAARWQWEVNLIGSRQINAFCMPGGKIAFYSGILDQLQLSDDEAAMVMGHEMAHALLDHARERMGKTAASQGLFEIGAALFGLGDVGRLIGGVGTQLLSLRFSRSDESEADALGLLLGAEAGHDPRAAVTLWRKMGASKSASPPQWLSTHPSSDSRIRELQARMPRASQVYAAARGRDGGPRGG